MVKPGGGLERSLSKTLREDGGSEGSRASRKGSSEVLLKELNVGSKAPEAEEVQNGVHRRFL